MRLFLFDSEGKICSHWPPFKAFESCLRFATFGVKIKTKNNTTDPHRDMGTRRSVSVLWWWCGRHPPTQPMGPQMGVVFKSILQNFRLLGTWSGRGLSGTDPPTHPAPLSLFLWEIMFFQSPLAKKGGAPIIVGLLVQHLSSSPKKSSVFFRRGGRGGADPDPD